MVCHLWNISALVLRSSSVANDLGVMQMYIADLLWEDGESSVSIPKDESFHSPDLFGVRHLCVMHGPRVPHCITHAEVKFSGLHKTSLNTLSPTN